MKKSFLFIAKDPILYAVFGAGGIYLSFEIISSLIALKNHSATSFRADLVFGFFIFLIAIFLLTIINLIISRKITVLKIRKKTVHAEVKEGEYWVFRVLIKLNLRRSIVVLIPVRIKLIFSGPFQAEDLEKLRVEGGSDSEEAVSMFDFIKQTFFDHNPRLYDVDVFDEEKRYFEAVLTLKKIKEGALKQINFPSQLFSNIESTDLKIGKKRFDYIEDNP